MRFRLSALMFIQWFTTGATMPILGHYLKNTLGFEPMQVGLAMAMPAIAAMSVPLFATRIADRWISSERFLATCHLIAGCVMLLLSRQHTFVTFLPVYLVYAILIGPTSSLSNAIAFHHITDAKRQYGRIRLWGTAGWIAAGLCFGLLWLSGGGSDLHGARLGSALVLSGFMSLILSVYAFTLPVPDKRFAGQTERPSAWASLRVLARPGIAALFVLSFLSSILNQFYGQWMSPFLSQEGFSDGQIMPLLTLGQVTEVIAMLNLGRVLTHLGMKRTLALGTVIQVVRFMIFSSGGPAWMTIAGIALHGMTYTFFYAAALVYLDGHCGREERAGAQFLHGMIFSGVGSLAGSLLAGQTAQWLTIQGTSLINFHALWFVIGAVAMSTLVVLLVTFRESAPLESQALQTPVTEAE